MVCSFFAIARPLLQWVPATLLIIAAAACFCGVVISNGTGGSKAQGIAALEQLNNMNGEMLVKQVPCISAR